ncbi:MAG: polysaccharide deacetylase family protein [Bacteroidetes bacterium]|nr:polysaccharide deacetylase family protein [Bacteroidota bacterium]
MANSNQNIFLFSIDLEDIRLRLKNPENYEERVPVNTHIYLNWLRKYNSKCTFFVTGDIAVLYPSLINEIVSEGHEIACHTNNHIPLDKQTPTEFRKDLEENVSVLMKAGAGQITGFRAPVFSLTQKTEWAYKVLSELTFSYSSSVLPAKNPFYGWETFGFTPRKVNDKIVEIPLTMGRFFHMTVPVFGGVYFRVLPKFFIKGGIKNCIAKTIPAVGYFHPYDIDSTQERYMNPGINDNYLYNFLMYYNRKNVFSRLDYIMNQGFSICTYYNYIQNNLK